MTTEAKKLEEKARNMGRCQRLFPCPTIYWQFGLALSLGAVFRLKRATLLLGTKFHVALPTVDTDTETYVEFNIGLGFN